MTQWDKKEHTKGLQLGFIRWSVVCLLCPGSNEHDDTLHGNLRIDINPDRKLQIFAQPNFKSDLLFFRRTIIDQLDDIVM